MSTQDSLRDGYCQHHKWCFATVHNDLILTSFRMMVKEKVESSSTRLRMMVEMDRKYWQSDRDWYRHQASMAGRLLTLRADRPWEHLQTNSVDTITRIDPQSKLLTEAQLTEMQYCHQIALYLSHYLNAISYNTDVSEICEAVQLLQSKLSHVTLKSARRFCNSTLLHLLLCGAMASRGHPQRAWFVRLLSNVYPEVQSMRSFLDRLDEATDTSAMVLQTVEEIWDDVLRLRVKTLQSRPPYREDSHGDQEGAFQMGTVHTQAPVFETSDLKNSVEVVEVPLLEDLSGLHFG